MKRSATDGTTGSNGSGSAGPNRTVDETEMPRYVGVRGSNSYARAYVSISSKGLVVAQARPIEAF